MKRSTQSRLATDPVVQRVLGLEITAGFCIANVAVVVSVVELEVERVWLTGFGEHDDPTTRTPIRTAGRNGRTTTHLFERRHMHTRH